MLNINIDRLFKDAIRTVALPFVLIMKENEKKKEKEKKNSKNKNKDTISNNTILTANENGCFIF